MVGPHQLSRNSSILSAFGGSKPAVSAGVGVTAKTVPSIAAEQSPAWQWHAGGLRTGWDGVRKEMDLWDPNGDCVVYLYARGTSKRPASIQISLDILRVRRCINLLKLVERRDASPQKTITRSGNISRSSSHSRRAPSSGKYELYLGVPKEVETQDVLTWHVTTRNFFAWLLEKPLVGPYLGVALNDLFDRMSNYRSDDADNLKDVFDFADAMGYTNFTHNPDYACAFLVFSETQRIEDTWKDAFSHCVGMSDLLETCPDYEALGNVNRALVTKTALRMDIELEAKTRAIRSLLDDDFSESRLGLTPAARDHLESFRSFIHSYLVRTRGYWPPRQDRFIKDVYAEMLADFEALYSFIGNFQKCLRNRRDPVSGGICVLQNLASFDERHGFEGLEARLPLLPRISDNTLQRSKSTGRSRSRARWSGFMYALRIGGKAEAHLDLRTVHEAATNHEDYALQLNPLVQAYLDFEADSATYAFDARLSHEDARKVRWLMIYGMLQMLRSTLARPIETTNAAGASYPLCCDLSDLPSWNRSLAILEEGKLIAAKLVERPATSDSAQSTNSIHPDGETDYETYFSSSSPGLSESPDDIHPALRRIAPLRSKSNARSFISTARPDALSRHLSSNSIATKDKKNRDRDREPRVPFVLGDGRVSPTSDVPSLEWSRDSFSSKHSTEEPSSPRSSSSSIYSDRPDLPIKSEGRGDVLDKGLAYDDLILPGLSI